MQMLHEMEAGDRNATFSDTYTTALLPNGRTCTVYLSEFSSRDEVLVRDVTTNDDYDTISIDDLNFATTDLGMYHDGDFLYYLARRPERQWRRGVRSSTCRVYRLEDDGSVARLNIRDSLGHTWFEKAIDHFFLHEEERGDGVVGRDWAFSGDMLYFRSLPVGRRISGSEIKIFDYLTDLSLPELEGYTYVSENSQ